MSVFITTIWEMHVISPIFLRLLSFMKKRLYFWRFHKEQHTCMIESQLWYWETNIIVYSVQSLNRKFRMFHYFYPFEDTSSLVEVFSFIFTHFWSGHIIVHTWVMALCIYSSTSHSSQPHLQDILQIQSSRFPSLVRVLSTCKFHFD